MSPMFPTLTETRLRAKVKLDATQFEFYPGKGTTGQGYLEVQVQWPTRPLNNMKLYRSSDSAKNNHHYQLHEIRAHT